MALPSLYLLTAPPYCHHTYTHPYRYHHCPLRTHPCPATYSSQTRYPIPRLYFLSVRPTPETCLPYASGVEHLSFATAVFSPACRCIHRGGYRLPATILGCVLYAATTLPYTCHSTAYAPHLRARLPPPPPPHTFHYLCILGSYRCAGSHRLYLLSCLRRAPLPLPRHRATASAAGYLAATRHSPPAATGPSHTVYLLHLRLPCRTLLQPPACPRCAFPATTRTPGLPISSHTDRLIPRLPCGLDSTPALRAACHTCTHTPVLHTRQTCQTEGTDRGKKIPFPGWLTLNMDMDRLP